MFFCQAANMTTTSGGTSMTGTPDPRQMYDRALAQTGTIIENVKPSQLDDPTPCDNFDVRALLSHLVGAVNRAATFGEGGDGLAVPARADGVPDDGWPDAFRQASDRARAAWADEAKLDRMVRVPWGEVPGRGALSGYVQEVLTHGWDLSKATGQPTELAPDLAEFALAFAHRALPPDLDRTGDDVPFDPPTTAPAASGPYTQLAAWLGRTP
jgi:uncharacterized protein (TIGR03086 family)